EHRAAAPGDARARVVIELDQQIVEMILAPKPVRGVLGAQTDRPIVAAVGRVLAPGIGGPHAAHRQPGTRPGDAVPAPPQAHEAKRAARGGAIAFALVRPDAGGSERRRQMKIAGRKPAFGPPTRPGADANLPQCAARRWNFV